MLDKGENYSVNERGPGARETLKKSHNSVVRRCIMYYVFRSIYILATKEIKFPVSGDMICEKVCTFHHQVTKCSIGFIPGKGSPR